MRALEVKIPVHTVLDKNKVKMMLIYLRVKLKIMMKIISMLLINIWKHKRSHIQLQVSHVGRFQDIMTKLKLVEVDLILGQEVLLYQIMKRTLVRTQLILKGKKIIQK